MPSAASAGTASASGSERDGDGRGDQPLPAEAMHVAPAERHVREQVDRRAAEQRRRPRTSCSSVADVRERLLDPERDQHDPGDHREVQVGERVARDRVALAARGGVDAAAARRPARRRRSTATTARRPPRSRRPRRRPRRASTPRCAPTPIATIDSPSAMSTISPWRSAKWCGTSRQPSVPMKQRPAHVEQQRERPQRALQRAVGERGGDRAGRTPIAVLTASPSTELAQRRVVAAGEEEQPDLRDADDRVGAGEDAARSRRTPSGRRARRPAAPPSRAKITSRTVPSSGSTTLVSHA